MDLSYLTAEPDLMEQMLIPIQEPLEELASFAWNHSPVLCRIDHGCGNYHRAWSLVRLLSGHATQLAGSDFFNREFQQLALHEHPLRVLISGGADTALTISVVNACRLAQVDANFIFIDRCATPCEQNKRLASIAAVDMEVICADILDIDIEPVDVVVSHNFLPFFDAAGRLKVIESWRRSCQKLGTLLISNTLVATESDWLLPLDMDAVVQRSRKLYNSSIASGQPDGVVMAIELAAQALWKSQSFVSPAMTQTNIVSALAAGGFQVESIHQRDLGSDNRAMGAVRGTQMPRIRAEIRASCIG